MRFPTIVAHDLEGRRYEIPGDLPVGPRIIVLAFQRWHTALIEQWQPELDRVVHEHPGTTWWEIPALSRVYAPVRPFIDGGMRAGIPDAEARRQTLTSYTDLRALESALGLAGFETIYVLLVDASGEVVWMGSGEVDDGSVAQLDHRVHDRLRVHHDADAVVGDAEELVRLDHFETLVHHG